MPEEVGDELSNISPICITQPLCILGTWLDSKGARPELTMVEINSTQSLLRHLRSSGNYNGIDIVVEYCSSWSPNRWWTMPQELTKAILRRLVQVKDGRATDSVLHMVTSCVATSEWATGHDNGQVRRNEPRSLYALDFKAMTHSDSHGFDVWNFRVCGPCVSTSDQQCLGS